MTAQEAFVLDAPGLGALIAALADAGYQVIGPHLKDAAICYEPIAGLEDLPRGWVDAADGGQYRLREEGTAFFDHVVGPTPWKRYLHPPEHRIWEARLDGAAPAVTPAAPPQERYAFFGVRACDLAAIAVQDRVFCDGPFADTAYATRRAAAFIVAVNCRRAVSTCFCTSMDTGPRATQGYDLALTEIATGDAARFLLEVGSDQGAAIATSLGAETATAEDLTAAERAVDQARAQITRRIDTDGLPERLRASAEHPRWAATAERCLNCTNCTMVCPTCFCTNVEDESTLDGTGAARVQRWASCFTLDFSHVHGGAVRPSPRSRYRQWMTHKLATWHDQFGTSGCTGCGRCIAWCPVGIDITEEAAAICEDPQ